MATFVPPKKNTAYVFYVSLISQATPEGFQASPTLAAGDVRVAIDDGAPANLATLPAVDADFTKRVKVDLSAAEMNGDNVTVIFSDVAGAQWCDLTVNLQTVANQIDDLSGRIPATLVGGRMRSHVEAQDNIDFGALQKTSLNAATPASVVGAVGSVTGAVGSVTGNVGGNVVGSVGSVTGHTPQTGDNYARLGAPVGASVSADVASVKTSVGAVTGAVGSVTGNVGGNLTGTVGSLAAQAKADVNAEMVDALNVDTYAEPGQEAPAATASLAKKIGYLFKAFRNRITQSATELKLHGDDGVTVDQKATVSDDGTTFDRGEIGTGP